MESSYNKYNERFIDIDDIFDKRKAKLLQQ